MQNSQLLFKGSDGKRLYSGLAWRLLDKNGSDRQLIQIAKEQSARFALRVQSTKGTNKAKPAISAGLYLPSLEDEDKPPLKPAHSMAACFAIWARQHPLAALAYQFPDAPSVYVAVVDAGLPVIDTIYASVEQAKIAIADYLQSASSASNSGSAAVFTNRVDVFTSGDDLGGADLLFTIAKASGKHTAISALPFDWVGIGIPLVIALLGLAAWMGWQKNQAALQSEALLFQAAQNDPTQKYQKTLAAAKNNAGLDAAALLAAYSGFVAMPTIIKLPGNGLSWSLTNLTCNASGCTTKWDRKNGTYEQLTTQLAAYRFKIQPSKEANLSTAFLSTGVPIKSSALAALPSYSDFQYGTAANQLQVWLTAGLTIQIGQPSTWPVVPGVGAAKMPGMVQTGSFEVANIALPQLAEAITTAPANVRWSDLVIDFSGNNPDPLASARAKLKGQYYVQ